METCTFAPLYAEHFPFWDTLAEKDRAALCHSTASVVYPRGTTIHDGTN